MIILLDLMCVTLTHGADLIPYSSGSPSNDEQYLLCLINRARSNPAAEGQRLALYMRQHQITRDGAGRTPEQVISDFSSYPARAPLAMNSALLQAARSHVLDLIADPSIGHTGLDGSTPAERATRSGYNSIYVGENALEKSSFSPDDIHASFLIDLGNPGLGHRHNLLNDQAEGVDAVEIGLSSDSSSAGHGTTVEDVAMMIPGHPLACGVVYRDNDRDGFYTPGEGLGGIRVTCPASSYYTMTSASGGYSLPLDTLVTHATSSSPLTKEIILSFTDAMGGVVSQTLPVGYLAVPPPNDWWESGYTNVSADRLLSSDPEPPQNQVPTITLSQDLSKRAFVITRTETDTTQPLAVNFEVIGKNGAVADVDFVPVDSPKIIPAGKTFVRVRVRSPDATAKSDGTHGTVLLRLQPSDSYKIGSVSKAKIRLGTN